LTIFAGLLFSQRWPLERHRNEDEDILISSTIHLLPITATTVNAVPIVEAIEAAVEAAVGAAVEAAVGAGGVVVQLGT